MDRKKRFSISIGNQMLIAITLVLIVLAFSNQFITNTQQKIVQKEKTTPTKSTPTKLNPTRIITQKPSPKTAISNTSLNPLLFQYPNSVNLGNDEYQSSDSPSAITNWYRTKIAQSGMSVQVTQTSLNGNIKNILIGNNEDEQIEIEIEKKAGDTVTKITIFAKST